MSDEQMAYEVLVGDQSFRVRIRPEEEARYNKIARFTDAMFKDVAGKAMTGGSRVWAMTAFQIACDLFEAEQQLRESSDAIEQTDEADQRIERLIRRIEDVTSHA